MWTAIRAAWRNIRGRERVDADLSAEVDSYIDMLATEAESSGMSRAEARRHALLNAGGRDQVKESIRDAKRGFWMDGVLSDCRYAYRTLRHSRGVSLVIIATLAITIGANTAIFSLAHSLLMQRLPYTEPDRVAAMEQAPLSISFGPAGSDFKLAKSIRENGVVESSALYYPGGGANLEGSNATHIRVAQVEPTFLRTLGATPSMGRDFTASDAVAGSNVVLLSDAVWRRLGSRTDIIGSQIRLSGVSFTVLGVMPSSMDYPVGTEVWTPTPLRADLSGAASAPGVILRIRRGISLGEARKRLAAGYLEANRARPDARADFTMKSLQEDLTQPGRLPLLLLLATVTIVLLIGCANVAALLLARVSSRQAEFIVRGAIGANARRIARQVVTEALMLGTAGAVCGLLVARATLHFLVGYFPPQTLPGQSVQLSGWAMAYTAATGIAAALLFGSMPALRASIASRIVPRASTTTLDRGQHRFRSILVCGEVALGLLLVLCAGLLTRSLSRLESVPLGMKPADVMTAQVRLPETRYATGAQVVAYTDRTLQMVRAIPGVQAAGFSTLLPLGTDMGVGMEAHVPGDERDVKKTGASSWGNTVNPHRFSSYVLATHGYLEALGVKMLSGRTFNESDGRGGSAYIISASVAQRLFGTTHAAGRRISIPLMKREGEVVGVTEELHLRKITDVGGGVILEAVPQVPALTLAVRFNGSVAGTSAALRRVLTQIDPDVPPYNVQPLRSVISASMGARSTLPRVVAIFAFLAVLLCALGTYGLQAEIVGRQTRALSIRMALGARPAQLVQMVLQRSLKLAAIGSAIGIVAGIAATRVLSSVLYETSPLDPAVFVIAAVVIACVTLVAAAPPALRASQIRAAAMLKE